MKVGITGVTPIQQNSPHRRTSYYDLPYAFEDVLTLEGHEVLWGKPLDVLEWGPDFLLAGMCDPRSIVANGIYDLAYAIEKHEVRGRSWAIYAPDWRIPQFLKGLAYLHERPNYLENPSHPQRRWYLERSPEGHRPLQRLVERLWHGDWPHVVIEAFDWGSDEVMLVNKHGFGPSEFFRVNPLPYYPVVSADVSTTDRLREWTLAVLWPYDWWIDRQGFTWPVTQLGHPKRLREPDLLVEYQRRWGLLAPQYDFKGSGLTRPRYKHAALLNLVLFTEKGELPFAPYERPLAEIEAMSREQLADLAYQQSSAYFDNLAGSKDSFTRRLLDLVEDRVGRRIGRLASSAASTKALKA